MEGKRDMTETLEKVGLVTLDYTDYSGKDLYLDGSEEELLDIVTRYPREAYNQVIEQKNTWPVLYHLSGIRGNIIEWMPITKEDRVLEIGAGCGAITGTLAAKAGSVDCIELSRSRSLVNATRNKDFDNIHIRVGNFQDVEKRLTEKYDYITLIGVFEYASSYINAKDPYHEFLMIIKKHLKQGGKIVIAIENKYGLKYWAGCKEDHTANYFSGIEGYVGVDFVRTFCKKELQDIADQAGLSKKKFYYPYPDYKLPLSIYSDEYLPKPGDLNNNFRNFDNERMVLFDESRVFYNIIKDGMFDQFSNSYLLVLEEA